MTEFEEIVNDLREYETEQEWFEFKENWFNPNELGQYISPLSNSAAYAGQKKAYFVWGIADKPHSIAGISFSPDCRVKNEPLKHYLSRQLSPNNNFEFTECSIEGKTVVLLTIPAAKQKIFRFLLIGSDTFILVQVKKICGSFLKKNLALLKKKIY